MTPYDTGQNFGTNVHVSFKMTYHPSRIGRFVEMPRLEWNEKFIVIEHHLQRRWMFEVDMYRHNPNSATLVIWRQRYFAAYDEAHGVPRPGLGSSRLLDTAGHPVKPSGLARASDNRAKTEAVQDYLKRNGGSLLIGIHDRPSINLPKQVSQGGHTVWENKERLLLFRCRAGGGQTFTGMQYLHVDGSEPRRNWSRSEQLSWMMPELPGPLAYTQTSPPTQYSVPRFGLPFAGEVD